MWALFVNLNELLIYLSNLQQKNQCHTILSGICHGAGFLLQATVRIRVLD